MHIIACQRPGRSELVIQQSELSKHKGALHAMHTNYKADIPLLAAARCLIDAARLSSQCLHRSIQASAACPCHGRHSAARRCLLVDAALLATVRRSRHSASSRCAGIAAASQSNAPCRCRHYSSHQVVRIKFLTGVEFRVDDPRLTNPIGNSACRRP